MKYLAKEAELSDLSYTNHLIRATVMTVLDENNFKAHHIIAVSGHHSDNTVKKYAKRCPEKKKKCEMAESLAVQLSTNKPKIHTITSENTEQNELKTIDTNTLDEIVTNKAIANDTDKQQTYNPDNYHMQLLPLNPFSTFHVTVTWCKQSIILKHVYFQELAHN